VARTRIGKKFITFPVSDEAKQQFDILAAETRQRREELMREALRDLFTKYRKPPIA
jgi:predicted transcriptional regulator